MIIVNNYCILNPTKYRTFSNKHFKHFSRISNNYLEQLLHDYVK